MYSLCNSVVEVTLVYGGFFFLYSPWKVGYVLARYLASYHCGGHYLGTYLPNLGYDSGCCVASQRLRRRKRDEMSSAVSIQRSIIISAVRVMIKSHVYR